MCSNVREMSSPKQWTINSVNDSTDYGDECRDQSFTDFTVQCLGDEGEDIFRTLERIHRQKVKRQRVKRQRVKRQRVKRQKVKSATKGQTTKGQNDKTIF